MIYGISGWLQHTNPDGQPYYSFTVQNGSDPTHTYITEENLLDDRTLGMIDDLVRNMEIELQRKGVDIELGAGGRMCIVFQQEYDNWS